MSNTEGPGIRPSGTTQARKAVVSKISIASVRYHETEAIKRRRAAAESSGVQSTTEVENKGRTLATIANEAIRRENLLRTELKEFNPSEVTKYGSAMHRFNLLQSTSGVMNLCLLRANSALPNKDVVSCNPYGKLSTNSSERQIIDKHRTELQRAVITRQANSPNKDAFKQLELNLEALGQKPINPQAQAQIKALCDGIDKLRTEFLSESTIKELSYVEVFDRGQAPTGEISTEFNGLPRNSGTRNHLVVVANPYTCSALDQAKQDSLKTQVTTILKSTWTLAHSIHASNRGAESVTAVPAAINKVKDSVISILKASDDLLFAELAEKTG